MATLKDIAREAGVSITTVSNVIHNKKNRASPELIAKIHETIKRMDYVPSMTARTLANKTSPIIGIINYIVSSGVELMTDPFHNIFMGSIEKRAREKGYFIMVRTVQSSHDLETVCRNWNLAGMILTGLFHGDFFESLRSLKIPYVLIDSYIDLPEVCNVGLEDQKGVYIATRHLLERGHRTIAFISPEVKENGVNAWRLQGYKQALLEFGISFEPNLVIRQELTVKGGISLGHRLSRMPEVTGIFASADILAAGIMAGLNEKGVKVPDDKSVIGFDDNYLCNIITPRLTTIHQDAEKKGDIAIKMMIAQLAKKPIKENKVILPVRLIERDSVRQIP